MPADSKILNLRLPPWLYEALREKAHVEHTSMNAIIIKTLGREAVSAEWIKPALPATVTETTFDEIFGKDFKVEL